MSKEYRKKRKKCRGKWKVHGELKTETSTNSLGNTVIQKICQRCRAYVSWQHFEKSDEIFPEGAGYEIINTDTDELIGD